MTRAKNNRRISIHLSQPIAGRVLEGIRALFPRDISRCRGFDSFNISDEERISDSYVCGVLFGNPLR